MIKLRPYQEKAVSSVMTDWNFCQRVLVMAATGTGKTIIYLGVADRILRENPNARILIIAHREELIFQPIERIERFWPHLLPRVGVVMAERNQTASQIVIATVQSLNSNGRLDEILAHGEFTHWIIDEAHHAVANTYRAVIDRLPEAKGLGCTATPKRTDQLALGKIFEIASYTLTIQDAVSQSILCPFTPLGFGLPVTTPEDWQPRNGDDRVTGDLLSAQNVMEIVLAKWREYAANRQTIAFTSSVAQAHATANYFNEHGVPAAAVDGKTPKDRRRHLLASYQSGEISVMLNCMVLTEGFDAPETACIMMIAPTKSDLVYTQRLGRGLRQSPGKEDCLVLDFAPMGQRNIIMATDILDGVPKLVKDQVAKAEDDGLLLFNLRTDEMGRAGYIDPFDVKAQVMNYLRRHHLAWSFDGDIAVAPINANMLICVLLPERQRMERAHELRRKRGLTDTHLRLLRWISSYRLYTVNKIRSGWVAQLAGTHDSIAGAQAEAENLYGGKVESILAEKVKRWRKQPVSDKQAAYLRQLDVYEPGLTRGRGSQLITVILARRAVFHREKILARAILAGAN